MKCQFCDSDKEYKTIGNHWRQSCGYPEPDDYMVGIFDGLMMGDANMKNGRPENRSGNQVIEVCMTNKEFVEYLYNRCYPFFNSPKLHATPDYLERTASDCISTNEDGFRHQYRITSKAIPFFNKYDSWFDGDRKRWDKDVCLTPKRVKYLYVSDGGISWNKDSHSARSQITSRTEAGWMPELASYFNMMGIDCRHYNDRIMFKPSSTDKFLNFIGSPVPGFEYKWENGSLDRYEELYRKSYKHVDTTLRYESRSDRINRQS